MAGRTILVVEDNPIQREGLAVILREQGHTVTTAADAEEALSRLQGSAVPDLILLDMMMRQGRDGWYFLAQRKVIPVLASAPIIITTGIGNASDDWAAALGACCMLRKPLEVESLMTAIRRCLGA
jgi:CheY-like chemotaxis protein